MPPPKPRRSEDPFRRRRETLLSGLGISPDSAARFVLPSRALPYFLPLPLVLFLAAYRLEAIASRQPLVFMAIVAGLVLAALLSLIPSRLTIGVDGIHLAWIGRARFLRHEDIEAIVPYDFWFSRYPGVRIQLRNGDAIHLCTSLSILFWRDRWSERDGILSLISNEREALARSRRKDRTAAPDLLARGGLSHADWVRALKSIGAGANATLRIAPVPPERLLAVVEDPSAAPSDRAAAAIAVSRGDDAESKRRVTAAAEATGNPTLKRALRIALSNDDAALAEALADAESLEEPARTGRRPGI
jgi:hypothetical protein